MARKERITRILADRQKRIRRGGLPSQSSRADGAKGVGSRDAESSDSGSDERNGSRPLCRRRERGSWNCRRPKIATPRIGPSGYRCGGEDQRNPARAILGRAR